MSDGADPQVARDDPIPVPLCIDLDGTLIHTDLLWESLARLVATRPIAALAVPYWLLRGKAYVKARIAERVELDVSVLPYDDQVLSLIEGERQRGRTVILATASNERLATNVADWLGIFDRVLASTETVNLSARTKRDRLLAEFGDGGYDYIGNGRADRIVWQHARKAIGANVPGRLANVMRAKRPGMQVLSLHRTRASDVLKAVRPHQWSKNVLTFIALAVSHKVSSPESIKLAVLAFVAFTFCSSAVYLINDALDLPADRHHFTKRFRPLAAGKVSLPFAAMLAIVLLFCGIGMGVAVGDRFAIALAAYLILTTAYSFYLKKKLLLDVLALAALYTLRIIAGAMAIEVEPSFWLLAFSMFLFLSLALVKRYSELAAASDSSEPRIGGRGYRAPDAQIIVQLGTASGYISVLVLALYINSDAVLPLYGEPRFLWLICPAMLYWISLVWFLAGRGELHDDPVVFAITDYRSYFVAAFVAVSVLLGTLV